MTHRTAPQQHRAIASLLLTVALATFATAIANTALSAIAADLHAAPTIWIWIVGACRLVHVLRGCMMAVERTEPR